MDLGEQAYKWVRKNDELIIAKFADPTEILPDSNPITLFMAGAPGAGKTEYAKSLILGLAHDPDAPTHFVHIDPDEIRKMFEGYDGTNADRFTRATSTAVGRLLDRTGRLGQNVIVDGTLSKFDAAAKDVEDSITKHKRGVAIFFVYQKPELAWYFTKARAADPKDGRIVDRATFIAAYVKSIENANKFKQKYGSRIRLNIVEKDALNKVKRFHFNKDNIDNYVERVYSIAELEDLLDD